MDAVDCPEKINPEKFFSLGPMKAGDVVFFPGSKIHFGRTASPETSSSVLYLDFFLCEVDDCECSQSTEYQPDVVQAKALTRGYLEMGFMKAMSDWSGHGSCARYPKSEGLIRGLTQRWRKAVEQEGGDLEGGHKLFLLESASSIKRAFGINPDELPSKIYGV